MRIQATKLWLEREILKNNIIRNHGGYGVLKIFKI